jgi:2-haloacid dehalogenase
MAVRHIVFDIGRVLVAWDPEIPYRRLIPDEAERRWFLAEVCSPEWNLEQDRGRSWEAGEAVLIARHPDRADLIRAFRRHWHEMVPGLLPETPQIMEALVDAGHDVTLLTNFHHETWPIALGKFPVLSKPRGVTVSGRLGVVKPERAIYDHHADTFGLDPQATIFFDDNAANVKGAQAAGWRAHRFTGPEGVRAELRAADIRPN